MDEIIEILKYTIPSIVTGGVAAYFLKQHNALENNKRKFELFQEKKKQSLPIRLQAYERMTLFLERIHLANITDRVDTYEANKIEYAKSLIVNINVEFEHNLVQQIYMSTECWNAIKNTKDTLLNVITAESMKENITSGQELKQVLKQISTTSVSPTIVAQQMIQQEVQNLF